jgi:hypothetical protein
MVAHCRAESAAKEWPSKEISISYLRPSEQPCGHDTGSPDDALLFVALLAACDSSRCRCALWIDLLGHPTMRSWMLLEVQLLWATDQTSAGPPIPSAAVDARVDANHPQRNAAIRTPMP